MTEISPNQQITFLKEVESFIPSNQSLVGCLTNLLEISSDSAYRRIRGETQLTFDEILTICNEYHISFDSFLSFDAGNMVSFQYHPFKNQAENLKSYFQKLEEEIKIIHHASADHKKLFFAGQSIPIFHYLKFSRLSAFKMFYWMKSNMNIPELQNEKFSLEIVDQELIDLSYSIFEHYVKLPSIEIWTDTTVLGTLHQIQFYWDCGMIPDKELALELCEDVRQLLAYVQKCAETTKKQDNFESPTIYGEKLDLYYSEIEFENNCVLIEVDDVRRVYLGQLSFGSLVTENSDYYEETLSWVNNIIRKSTQISGISDTMRYQFFKRSQNHLDRLEEKIKQNE